MSAVNCASCGSSMTSSREHHRYTEGGFDNVTLMNVEVFHCKACGEWEVVLPRIEDLHQLLIATTKRRSTAPMNVVFASTWQAAR
jgi:YgiT-type zinc finger domain-containing protein